MKTAVTGSGLLGPHVATNLRKAGVETVILRPQLENAVQTHPVASFSRDSVVLFVVTDDVSDAEDALFSQHGILQAAKALEVLILLGKLSETDVRNIRNRVPRHIEMVDAVPFGSIEQAKEGRLSFAMGGKPDVVDEVMLHFAALGDEFQTVGPLGSAAAQSHVYPHKN